MNLYGTKIINKNKNLAKFAELWIFSHSKINLTS